MNRITDVDLVSQTVSVEAGVRGDQLEEALAEHGLTAGLYPQSIAISTVGGWIAASSAGQASTGFGAIEDVLLGLTAVLPEGEILRCKPVPRSAAGPDLRRLLVGSEGTLAVVTEATLACRARPAGWDWLAFAFPDFTALADGLRQAVRAQTGAAVIRGYDETDAQLSFGALGHAGGCVGLLGFPAGLPGLAARKQAAAEAMQQAGASGELGARYGEHWWQHRNDAVQTYAQIMGPERAFGSGVIVDTFEVAGLWSAVPRLYQASGRPWPRTPRRWAVTCPICTRPARRCTSRSWSAAPTTGTRRRGTLRPGIRLCEAVPPWAEPSHTITASAA